MTILDLKNDVYKFLLKHDEININQFIQDNSIIEENLDDYRAYLTTVLNDFTELKVLREVKVNHVSKWILTQPINSYSQNVELSAAVAIFASEVINDIAEVLDDASLACDASSIREKDIKVLIGIAKEYLQLVTNNTSKNDE